MSGELRVTASHLRALSGKQAVAAGDIAAATSMSARAVAAVRTTHGVIGSASADALAAIDASRRNAGSRMAEVSHRLSERLDLAASRYETVDGAMATGLDRRMREGWR